MPKGKKKLPTLQHHAQRKEEVADIATSCPKERRSCCLCDRREDNVVEFGEKLATKDKDGKDIICHHFCLLVAKGEDEQGIKGYLPEDIGDEKNRAKRLKCAFCKKMGATAACCVQNCKIKYHVPCAAPLSSETTFREKKFFFSP
jgi:G2/M phase-specific E3 ubiquitin-protein ligase